MNAQELLAKLQNETEMNADSHDGSYEIMRATIDAYSKVQNWDIIDYTDLDLIYLMAVGTFSDGLEKKKERVRNSHLPQSEKNELLRVLDDVWDNACSGVYTNDHIPDKYKTGMSFCFGMFGTGFFTFSKCSSDGWNAQVRNFIKMLIDIRNMDDDDEIFDRAEKILNHPIKGLQAASVSIILHCLKPYTFPILNGGEGNGNCYEFLGIPLVHSRVAETYIGNCRKIKQFRDTYFKFKNYRIIDLMVSEMDGAKQDDLWPSVEEYPTILTKEQWIEFLSEDSVEYPDTMAMLKCMNNLGGEATCKKLAQELGGSPTTYVSRGTNLGKRVKEKYGLPACMDGDVERYFPIPFQGHRVKQVDENNTLYAWVLRKELKEALEEIPYEEYSYKEETILKKNSFPLNTILYGPPGTGKTYNSVVYAVSIVENKELKEIVDEANEDYLAVKKRFDDYKKAGRIAFTTFHQSYSYEEFIEGIRPRLSEEDSSGLNFTLESGVFKEFCDKAYTTAQVEDEEYGLNKTPVVWKVSLAKTYDNPVREECMKNNHIRIGWDDFGPDITDSKNYPTGKAVLNAFVNKMRIGDIVLSCYTSSTIDAIGVVAGDYEWDDSYEEYKRVRKVNWIVKGIKEDIVDLNGGSTMTLSTVYQMKISAGDVMKLVAKIKGNTTGTQNLINKDNYVFIIDEINRGNISKIFGELITLIEETKRLGAKEEMKALLPYSKREFGVPNNVYILGTMNTADRSIALMDTALRRRFNFIEMMPNVSIINDVIVSDKGENVNIADMLSVINSRIECLFDREHTIGHAFFTKLKQDPSIKVLGSIFKESVIPLLQEYFYEDYDKIRLVLGDNGKDDEETQFVTKRAFDYSLFNSGTGDDLPDDKSMYEINENAYENIWSYKGISKNL